VDTELLKLRERVLVAAQQRTPLQIHGARTKDFYGEYISGEPLDVGDYRGIIDYEPSELVITARCGTRLTEIEAALAERGQFLGFEPPRPANHRGCDCDRIVRTAPHAGRGRA
jgi:glycolate oxidase FAD binding subunit